MYEISESLCKDFGIPSVVLKLNETDEQYKAFIKQIETSTFEVLGVPIKFLENNNG